MPILARIWHQAMELVLPSRCVGCGARGAWLCAACLAEALRVNQPCPGCAAPGWPSRCARCRAAPFAFDDATAPFAYGGVARKAVHRLKFRNLRALAPLMAVPMAEAIASKQLALDIVAPVPLHARRLRERGYNQAGLLAAEVARRLVVADSPHALLRRDTAQAQVSMATREQRRANVADAFAIADGVAIAGKRVLLIDDVLTTGSTLDSAARTLKAGGARSVHALTFAREE